MFVPIAEGASEGKTTCEIRKTRMIFGVKVRFSVCDQKEIKEKCVASAQKRSCYVYSVYGGNLCFLYFTPYANNKYKCLAVVSECEFEKDKEEVISECLDALRDTTK